MKKILIIPSWYPTKKRPIEGSFFQEQALAMKQFYDIKIFYPKKIQVGRLLRLFNTLLYFLKIKPSIEFIKDNFANDPEKFLFHYIGGVRKLKLDEKLMEWQCNTAFEKIIKSGWKPELIHAQCTAFGGIISYFISKKYNIPYIITEHNVFLFHLYLKETQDLMRPALENAKIVLSVSEHQKRMILMHDIHCHPIVVGNMIDENIFRIAPEKHQLFTILYIGYDHYIKDNETFFKAVNLFHQKLKEPFKIKLLGRTRRSAKANPFLILAKNYGVTDFIEIVENVERGEIVKYFQESDVVVSTSIAETFGVSMCEALFCGIPIISTANGGVDEMINVKNGIKVNIQDESAICDALIKIFNKEIVFDPQEIRNTVIDKFSKQTFIKKLDRIYCSAIDDTTKF